MKKENEITDRDLDLFSYYLITFMSAAASVAFFAGYFYGAA